MFTPTKQELIELWFTVAEQSSKDEYIMTARFAWNENIAGAETYSIFFNSKWELHLWNRHYLFPQSLDDLKTLIRLLTPPWV